MKNPKPALKKLSKNELKKSKGGKAGANMWCGPFGCEKGYHCSDGTCVADDRGAV